MLSETNLGNVSIDFPSHMQGFAAEPDGSAADGLSCRSILTDSGCQDQTAAWGDWKACMEKHLGSIHRQAEVQGRGAASPFSDFIFRCSPQLAWATKSSYTAVLLEFRALEREMRFSVDNVMKNLPIDWRMQIVGGADVCKLAFELYSAEIAAQKVIVTFLPYDDVQQVT